MVVSASDEGIGDVDRTSVTRSGLSLIAFALPCSGPAHAAFPVAGNGDIAYHRFAAGGFGFEVFSMRSTGAGQLNLTNAIGFDGNPSYSPTGRRIVFVRAVGSSWISSR